MLDLRKQISCENLILVAFVFIDQDVRREEQNWEIVEDDWDVIISLLPAVTNKVSWDNIILSVTEDSLQATLRGLPK